MPGGSGLPRAIYVALLTTRVPLCCTSKVNIARFGAGAQTWVSSHFLAPRLKNLFANIWFQIQSGYSLGNRPDGPGSDFQRDMEGRTSWLPKQNSESFHSNDTRYMWNADVAGDDKIRVWLGSLSPWEIHTQIWYKLPVLDAGADRLRLYSLVSRVCGR